MKLLASIAMGEKAKSEWRIAADKRLKRRRTFGQDLIELKRLKKQACFGMKLVRARLQPSSVVRNSAQDLEH